ncbi:Uncharacterised protein [uncultured archaeon]|nr:Uncharacterised protein [uncultured archaeon]
MQEKLQKIVDEHDGWTYQKICKLIEETDPELWKWVLAHCDSSLGKRMKAKILFSALHNEFCFTCPHGYQIKLTEHHNLKFSKEMQENCDCYEKYLKSDMYREKTKKMLERLTKSCLMKYGVENANNDPVIKEKKEQSCLKKYGTRWPTQLKEIHQKAVDTCRKRYGRGYPIQCRQFKGKIVEHRRETWKKNGEEINRRIIQNRRKNADGPLNWGHIRKEIQEILLDKEKFETALKKSSIQELSSKFGVSESFLRNIYHGFGLKFKKSCECFYENEVAHWLESIGIDFRRRDRKQIHPFELDFYIPSKNIGIEFPGDFWHMNPKIYFSSSINETNHCSAQEIWNRDARKKMLCDSKGIDLRYIWEFDWRNSKENVKEDLKKLLIPKDSCINSMNGSIECPGEDISKHQKALAI